MLTIHHLAKSQSERIIWLCEELGIPYEMIRYERDATGMAPPEYRALHAFGTSPVISDGELVLPESGAIVEYICRKHGGGRLMPGPDDAGYADYLHWFHFSNGSMIPAMMLERLAPQLSHQGVVARGARAIEMIEARLGEAPFFAGEAFTAADIMMCLHRFAAMRDLSVLPNIASYIERMKARPACQRSMVKAEPDGW